MHFCMFLPKHQDICGRHLLWNQAVCPQALTSELCPTKVSHQHLHITSKAAIMISLAFFTWFLRVRAPASSHLFLGRTTFSTLQLSKNLLRCFIRKHCSLNSSVAASVYLSLLPLLPLLPLLSSNINSIIPAYYYMADKSLQSSGFAS